MDANPPPGPDSDLDDDESVKRWIPIVVPLAALAILLATFIVWSEVLG